MENEAVTLIVIIIAMIMLVGVGWYAYNIEQKYNELIVDYNECEKSSANPFKIGRNQTPNTPIDIPIFDKNGLNGGDFNG